MKKTLSVLTAILLIACLALSACGQQAAPAPVTEAAQASSAEETSVPAKGLRTNGGMIVDLERIDVLRPDSVDPAGHYLSERNDATEGFNSSVVYFTSDISSEGLVRLYNALGWKAGEKPAIKISTGETGSNYLKPELIEGLVKSVNGTIVECNTAYQGGRTDTAAHYKLAEEHGYTKIAKVDIMDEEGSMTLPVNCEGSVIKENYVGSHFADYDSFIILSHFKGHGMAGFGGAIKNTSIGIASAPEGKIYIHNGGRNSEYFLDESFDYLESSPSANRDLMYDFQLAMAEATLSVSDALNGGKNIIYINVMNNISVDCDCNPQPVKSDIHDVGILASTDPVALDNACLEIAALMDGSGTLLMRAAQRLGAVSLIHGEEIGLGTRYYYLENID